MNIVIVKIGGTIATDASVTEELLRELHTFGKPVVLVHGGGRGVTETAARFGITSKFKDGVRLTTPAEMPIVDMVLAGETNTALVRIAQRVGISAVGLTGADTALLVGEQLFPGEDTRTARVQRVHPEVLYTLIGGGILPVVATVASDESGHGVNINADEAAQAIAQRVGQEHSVSLCYISDTPGVLDAHGEIIPAIPLESIDSLIADGVVQGGMAAKIRACGAAVQAGVQQVVIGTYRSSGDVAQLLSGAQGTVIQKGSTG